MRNLKSFSKKIARIAPAIIFISFLIFIHSFNFGIEKGYFISDIEFFQTRLDVYSKYATGIFVFISFLFLILKNRNKIKSKDPNIISPEFLKHTPLILFIALIIYANFDKTVTAYSLIINKQKQISSVEKEYEIYFYDEKKEELRLIINNLEFYKMKKDIYKNLEDRKNIKLKFKIGLLGIPFDPEFKK